MVRRGWVSWNGISEQGLYYCSHRKLICSPQLVSYCRLDSIIAFTAILTGFFGGLLVYSALVHGGEFYVNDFYGRRKKWIEKLLPRPSSGVPRAPLLPVLKNNNENEKPSMNYLAE